MRIAQSLIDEIVAHAREDLPNECCGMVGGGDGEARTVYPGRERRGEPAALRDRRRRSSTTPDEDDRGRRARSCSAIYHSHTKSAAYPSQTDVNQAVAGPTQVYLIVSLADPDAPDVKGYLLGPEDRRCRDRHL